MLIASENHVQEVEGYQCLGCGTLFRRATGFCLICLKSGLVVGRFRRPADSQAPVTPGMTARELAAMDQRTIKLRAYPELVLAPGAFVVAHGCYGGGKSTQALMVADSLKPSCVLSLEEGIGGANLSAKLRRLEIRSEQIRFEVAKSTSEVFALAGQEGLQSLIVDSVTVSTLQPEDVLAICRSLKLTVWCVVQETKAGRPAGTNKWPHAADVVLKVEKMQWELVKSRYQQAGLKGAVL